MTRNPSQIPRKSNPSWMRSPKGSAHYAHKVCTRQQPLLWRSTHIRFVSSSKRSLGSFQRNPVALNIHCSNQDKSAIRAFTAS